MCLKDVETLPKCVLSVVCHMIEAIGTALHNKQITYKTSSGREVIYNAICSTTHTIFYSVLSTGYCKAWDTYISNYYYPPHLVPSIQYQSSI